MKNKIIKLKKPVIDNNGNEYDELLVSHDLNNASLTVKVRSSHDHALCVVLSYDFRALKKERQENQFFVKDLELLSIKPLLDQLEKQGVVKCSGFAFLNSYQSPAKEYFVVGHGI